jgi:hypothetical protein
LRWKIALATTVFVIALPTAAFAKGPSGSNEATNGQVKCGKGTVATPVGVVVYAGPNGAELCDGNNTPPDGRIIVTPNYVAIDGDPSNPGQSSGFIRIDKSGPSCGDTKHHDSTKPGGSCVPAAP